VLVRRLGQPELLEDLGYVGSTVRSVTNNRAAMHIVANRS
jgi:hypothetical protein